MLYNERIILHYISFHLKKKWDDWTESDSIYDLCGILYDECAYFVYSCRPNRRKKNNKFIQFERLVRLLPQKKMLYLIPNVFLCFFNGTRKHIFHENVKGKSVHKNVQCKLNYVTLNIFLDTFTHNVFFVVTFTLSPSYMIKRSITENKIHLLWKCKKVLMQQHLF